MFSQEHVWASAVLAHKLNGGYYNRSRCFREGPTNDQGRRSNTALIMSALKDHSDFAPELIQQGQTVRSYLSRVYTSKSLCATLNEFESSDAAVLGRAEFESDDVFSVANVARLIQRYDEFKATENCLSRVPEDCIGKVASRANFDMTVVSSSYSTRYDSYIVKGIVNDKVPVMFFYKKPLDSNFTVSARATVKRYNPDIVQLNRVIINEG